MVAPKYGTGAAPKLGQTAGTPQWPELPEETRQALTVLIVRLFVDHANCARLSQQKDTVMMHEKIGQSYD